MGRTTNEKLERSLQLEELDLVTEAIGGSLQREERKRTEKAGSNEPGVFIER